MAHFYKTTIGHPVIMGRKTWETLPVKFRPLPGRFNIVVSRDPNYLALGAQVVGSLHEAIRLANNQHPEEDAVAFVIGGAQLYACALSLTDELMMTEINANFEGDTIFPVWNHADFEEISRVTHTATSLRTFGFDFVLYRRIAPAFQIPFSEYHATLK